MYPHHYSMAGPPMGMSPGDWMQAMCAGPVYAAPGGGFYNPRYYQNVAYQEECNTYNAMRSELERERREEAQRRERERRQSAAATAAAAAEAEERQAEADHARRVAQLSRTLNHAQPIETAAQLHKALRKALHLKYSAQPLVLDQVVDAADSLDKFVAQVLAPVHPANDNTWQRLPPAQRQAYETAVGTLRELLAAYYFTDANDAREKWRLVGAMMIPYALAFNYRKLNTTPTACTAEDAFENMRNSDSGFVHCPRPEDLGRELDWGVVGMVTDPAPQALVYIEAYATAVGDGLVAAYANRALDDCKRRIDRNINKRTGKPYPPGPMHNIHCPTPQLLLALLRVSYEEVKGFCGRLE